MLEAIITNKSFPTFILIQDENTVRAQNLLMGILKRDIENINIRQIHMICTKNPPEFYLSLFDNKRILTYNLFKDPCCWIESDSFDCDTLFKKILLSEDPQSTVMIDSINSLILLKDINYIFSIIQKLKKKFMRVICLVQGDMINNTDFLKRLSFFSNIFIKVQSNFSEHMLNSSDKNCITIEGIHKKPSGKVVLINELYKIDDNYIIQKEIYDNKKQDDNKSCKPSSMKGLTTFRMGLDIQENEKIARDNLILPYLRTANKKHGTGEERTEGKIVYYAESNDDLEEDPDDDLDI